MPDLTIFGQRLKKLRQDLGLSQRDFASRIGVTASALSSYEKGTMNPSLAVAVNAATEFGESLDWLCGLTENDRKGKQLTELENGLYYFLLLSDVRLIQDYVSEYEEDAAPVSIDVYDPLDKLLLAHCQLFQMLKNNMIDQETFDKINLGAISKCAVSIAPLFSKTTPDTKSQPCEDAAEENK